MGERRVAVVYDCLFPVTHGGGERVYRRLSELLAERGYEVDYLTRDLPGGSEAASTFTVVPLWRGPIYDDRGVRAPSGALKFARGVYQNLRAHRGRYDLVVASALPVLTLLAARIALRGTTTVLVGDWLEVWTWRKWRSYSGFLAGTIAWILQWVGAGSTRHHTVNSSFTRRNLMEVRPSLDPVVLGLVDLVDREAHPELAPASGAPFILFVGRLIPDKRADVIPAALEVARRSIPNLHAVLVGDGPESDSVRTSIAAHGLEAEIRMLSRIPEDQLEALLRSAAVLVNPSRREGFGLVVVEAAAVGTPSIVVRGADNAAVDLVCDDNGVVVDEADPQQLAAAIVRIVSAGRPLRESTAEWFAAARGTDGLEASLDRLLARLDSAPRSTR